MWQEVLSEALAEIAARPWTFVIELVQFAFLVFLIKAVGFGFRGRRGMVTGMLDDRRERIRQALEDAASADEELVAAHSVAADTVARARRTARETVAEARRAAQADADRVVSAIDAEIAEVRRLADETLSKERAEMLAGVQDELVDLVTLATRQILDESYTPSEQRSLIQHSVLESLDDLESLSLH